MKLKGANLGIQEVEYDNLTNYKWTKDEKIKRLIEYIEKNYQKSLKQKDTTSIESFPIADNGKVIIKPGMINHRCANDYDTLSFIAKHGVLASEWFGILESEREACFCAFVSRMKNDNYPFKGDLAEDNYSRLNIGKDILLFFDENNPVMQSLLHLDYFEYESIKQQDKEQLPNLYTDDEIELFDTLIEPLSPAGKDMRKTYDIKTNYWSAIPGGIPSFLINGICIKNNELSEWTIEEISALFPNATIFNSSLDILHYPYNAENNNRKTI